MRAERAKLSRHASMAKAIDYMLKRWDGFARFLEDGRICLTNNAAERALSSLTALAELSGRNKSNLSRTLKTMSRYLCSRLRHR